MANKKKRTTMSVREMGDLLRLKKRIATGWFTNKNFKSSTWTARCGLI